MPTFAYRVYAPQKRLDGTYNVKIRIIHRRKVKNLRTPYYVTESQLTSGKKRIKDQRLIDILERDLKKMRDICAELGYAAELMDLDRVIAYIMKRLGKEKRFHLDFVAYGREKAAEMKPGSAQLYTAALNGFERKFGHPDITDITIDKAEAYIKSIDGLSAKFNHCSALSTIWKAAQKRYNDPDEEPVIGSNPFARLGVEKPETRSIRDLTLDQMQAIIDLPYEIKKRSSYNLARDIFLMSFCLMGMNPVDMWSARISKDGVIRYRRQKTGVYVEVRIPDCIRPIVNKYSDGKRLIALDEYKSFETFYQVAGRSVSRLGDDIKRKGLTMYVARHAWASFARNEACGDKWTVHECIAHAAKDTAMDDVYIRKDFTNHWALNEKVMALFDWANVR